MAVATTTAVVSLITNDWTLVADGSVYSQVTAQLRYSEVLGPVKVRVFIGAAKPADLTPDNVIELDPFVSPVTPPIALSTTDKVYAWADKPATKLGLIKVSI